jgi:hypothetical protein
MNTPPSRRVRPSVELLEERCTPAAAAITVSNHVLNIVTDGLVDTVNIQDNGHGHVSAQVVTSHGTFTKTANGINQIELSTPTGRDTINYKLTDTLFTSEKLDFNLGRAADTLNLDFSKGVSASSLNLSIHGGQGREAIDTFFGEVKNTKLGVSVQLGQGPAVYRGHLNGNILGTAQVGINVKGGSDVNMIDVESKSSVAATASLAVNFQAGQFGDGMWFNYQGQMNGKLTYQATGGKGNDLLSSGVTFSSGSKGTASLKTSGAAGGDYTKMLVRGTTLKHLDASVDGGAGDDYALTTSNVKVTNVEARKRA